MQDGVIQRSSSDTGLDNGAANECRNKVIDSVGFFPIFSLVALLLLLLGEAVMQYEGCACREVTVCCKVGRAASALSLRLRIKTFTSAARRRTAGHPGKGSKQSTVLADVQYEDTFTETRDSTVKSGIIELDISTITSGIAYYSS